MNKNAQTLRHEYFNFVTLFQWGCSPYVYAFLQLYIARSKIDCELKAISNMLSMVQKNLQNQCYMRHRST